MNICINGQVLRNWMQVKAIRPEDLAHNSKLSIGTVQRALQGKPISRITLLVLSQVTKLTESQLLAKSKGQKSGGAA